MLYPNSYSLVSKDQQVEVNHPVIKFEHDKEYRRMPDIPRVYHKRLLDKDKINIYGKDVFDRAEANIFGVEVLPLTPQQKDFFGIEDTPFTDD